ncbi:MAG TPA: radical SAM protein [Elusimicrobiota bacterium]|nr:radical SAM protein [Elusimicrobiota bacterium]
MTPLYDAPRPDILFAMSPAHARDMYMPIYFLYLAGYLEKKGYRTEIVDPHRRGAEDNIRIILDRVAARRPRYVGLSSFATDYGCAVELARRIKEISDAKVVVGNAQPSLTPEDYLFDGSPFDIVVRGEGELTLEEILSRGPAGGDLSGVRGIAYRENGRLVLTEKRELMDLALCAMPAYHKVDMRWYRRATKHIIRRLFTVGAVVYTGRGCPFRCSFCAANSVWQTNRITTAHPMVRKRPLPHVMAELRLLQDTYGFDFFYILDDTFGIHEKDITDFCEAYRASGLRMLWAAETRVNCLKNDAIFKTLKSAGCLQLDFGVESGSQKLLNAICKGINVPQVVEAFDLCRRNGIRTFANILLNLPGEDENDLVLTEQLLEKIRPDYISIGVTQPYPGTAISRGLSRPLTRDDYAELSRLIPSEKFRLSKHNRDLYKLVSAWLLKYRAIAPFDRSVLRADASYWKALLASNNKLNYAYFILRDLVTYPVVFAIFLIRRIGLLWRPSHVPPWADPMKEKDPGQ